MTQRAKMLAAKQTTLVNLWAYIVKGENQFLKAVLTSVWDMDTHKHKKINKNKKLGQLKYIVHYYEMKEIE